MRGFYMDEAFTGSPSDLQHISHDTNFTAKQWVDNTSASLAPIEATSTASQPYTVGKRLVYGGRLYKVTQAIAQGGTLTPGTNITPDTVDEELSTISTHLTATEANGGLLNSKKMNCKQTTLTTDGNGILALNTVIGNPATHNAVYGVVCNVISANYYGASSAYCILTDVQGVQYQNWQARVTNLLTGQALPNTEFIVRVMWWEGN